MQDLAPLGDAPHAATPLGDGTPQCGTGPVLPDFLVIGAIKAATSTVSTYLEAHPGVFMVAGQDPNYFSDDAQWARGAGWYGGLFAAAPTGRLRGEGTNNYTSDALFPETASRIAATCPEVKLIYIVRDPVARIVSHWIQVRADQGDAAPPSLDAAVTDAPERFVAPSLYWRQLARHRAYAPDRRIWIGFMEDLAADSAAFLADLSRFLGIAPQPIAGPGHVNASQGKRVPGMLYSRLRRVPGLTRMARWLPDGVRHSLRTQLLSRPVQTRPAFSPAVLDQLRTTLAPDSRRFLAHCGRPAAIWSAPSGLALTS